MSYLIDLPTYVDFDGKLGTFEPDSIPEFKVKRVFYLFDIPPGQDRANHACMNAAIVFIAIAGSVKLSVEKDGVTEEYVLDSKRTALVVPKAAWIQAHDFSIDAVLMGLSDKKYQDCEYINDYEKYRELIKE